MADVKVRIIAVDEASVTIGKTGDEVEKTGKKAKEAGSAFEGLGKHMLATAGGIALAATMDAVTSALRFAVVGSFELAAALEQTTVGFTTMLGSGEAAQGMLNDLRDFAAKTPFQFDDLTQAASRMIAMGTAAEDVIPTLTAVGDAAAGLGLGKAGVDRITLALGQMSAKGKIGGDDLRQLAEAGVPALRYLADAAGVSTAEMSKMIEKGIIPADEGVKVLIQSMSGDFGGLMEEQAKTASGSLSNLEDAAKSLATTFGERMLPTVNRGAQGIAGLLQALNENERGFAANQNLAADLADELKRGTITQEEYAHAIDSTSLQAFSGALLIAGDRVKDMDEGTKLLAEAQERATFEQDRAADSTNENYNAINKLVPRIDDAKAAVDAYKASLALQASSFGLVSGAIKEYDTDQAKLKEEAAKQQKVIDDLTASHGKNQAAILAGSGTIKDNSTELEKSSIKHRELKQDMQQLIDKHNAGKISGDDYTLAMDKLNIAIRDQNTEHGKLITTQGTGLTATQLAATEQGNFNIKVGEATAALEATRLKEIELQSQVATRIKEGIVLEGIASAAKDGLSQIEIERIKAEATALGIADSDAIASTLLVQDAATQLAGARKRYAGDFESDNAAGKAAFTAYVNSISSDVTNKMQPDLKKAEQAAKDAGKEVRELVSQYNAIQSKDVTIRITTIRQVLDQKVAGGMTVAAAVASVSGGVVAGAKAGGGPVMGGAGAYLVGERGPELFNPSGTGGTITPNHALGRSGLAIGTLNVYGVQSTSELFNQLSREARARGLQFAVN